MKTVFVTSARCIGCRQCEFACAVAHSKSRNPSRAAFELPAPISRIFVESGPSPNRSLPVNCRHCNPAPCEMACPTGAIVREETYGTIQLGADKCIACAMCSMVCPFDVVTFHVQGNGHPARLVAVKCDACIDRRQRDELPACVEVCKTGALVYGELDEVIAQARREASSGAGDLSDPLAIWRDWGEAAMRLAKDASHDNQTPR